jgi:solute carrier family 25 phosphate transporter 23/24/25/41
MWMRGSKFWVLRGSETKPNVSLGEAGQHVSESQAALSTAHTAVDAVRESLVHLKEISDGDDVQKEEVQQLKRSIAQLQTKVDELEKKELKAYWLSQESQKEYTTVLKQLGCGGAAGAIARTTVAPIDRVKILMQTQAVSFAGSANTNKYSGIVGTLSTIVKEEGVKKLWRGNFTNVFRVIPYAATQFAAYDVYKDKILNYGGNNVDGNATLSTGQRLLAGGLSGMTATTLTHPLDVIRLRLNVQPELRGAYHAFQSVMAENGMRTLMKGYAPTVLSLSPFIAINFASFDILKSTVYPDPDAVRSPMMVLLLGACAGLVAQTCCYPLDTVRRRMQMKGKIYSSTPNAFATIFKTEGMGGFYKGMLPNAVKVVPNNAIRFFAYETLKKYMGVEGRKRS